MTTTDDFDYRSELIESYDKYVLEAKQDSVGAPIFITAVLEDNERVGNVLNDPEDAKFNLSPYMGVNDKGHLFWDATGRQFAGRLNNPRVEQKYINNAIANVITVAIGVDPKKGEDRQWLQLDGRLDIIEDYDVVSRQFKIRLGLKPDSSKRSIVLCFDGTSNRFSNQNTNVIKLVELLKKNDPSEQMVYYQAGVGTYSHPGFLTGLGSKIARIADEAFAW
ncbi:hypothetical protein BN14_06026 [Rhizoctonia solani AG-1 IB]|nr:hypothetical protein BN14_06026 [Rhizoctonia solani AG-1 IB]